MIFSENRFPLFGIMRFASLYHGGSIGAVIGGTGMRGVQAKHDDRRDDREHRRDQRDAGGQPPNVQARPPAAAPTLPPR